MPSIILVRPRVSGSFICLTKQIGDLLYLFEFFWNVSEILFPISNKDSTCYRRRADPDRELEVEYEPSLEEPSGKLKASAPSRLRNNKD